MAPLIAIALALVALLVGIGVEAQKVDAAWLSEGYRPTVSISHSRTRQQLEALGCTAPHRSQFATETATGHVVVVSGRPDNYTVCHLPQGNALMISEQEQQLDDDDAAADAAIAAMSGSR